MIRTFSDIQQDTTQHKTVVTHDSVRANADTGRVVMLPQVRDTTRHKSIYIRQVIVDNSDTTSVCKRNSIDDVTFYDFHNFITRLGYGYYKQFPFVFIEKNKKQQAEDHTVLINSLKPGIELPSQPLRPDWMIVIIIVAAFLFSLVKQSSSNFSTGFARFFLFRGVNESKSRESNALFHWQSTVLNLVSFLIIGLFGYSVFAYYELIPEGFKGIVIWLIAMGIISSAITLRHLVCIITGAASDARDVFNEYLLSIYQSYRFGAVFLGIIIILISYTRILSAGDLIVAGIIIAGLMYLIRVIRLLVIFINRSISIFYLILYLCALEILPVLIIAKYFTGLV
jgi:hypothetical protein